ncbi:MULTISPECIES: helix-turn-helix domain-containing protein [Arenibacter]|uniref:helix-turn-helix domain-containing protein n=1 Tax=Arenibacter TaxID=178469 RepID=UPI00068F256F|nr:MULTISPECIES: helix-turn-helix transcriptional regulator [Arenibacter]GBF19530.1 helix-turn-helix domain protein [Arenibacter sp. NBRC 103722]
MELLRLKELLSESGINGKTLADKTGVSQNTISNIVSGKNFPKPDLLLKIAEVLDVDVREMFNSTKNGIGKPLVNGFLEFRGEIHKITSVDNLELFLQRVKEVE